MKDFWMGVNYWASHAGTDMWRQWDANTVQKDFASLREQGVRVLRVFPNWRDFQPVTETFSGGHSFREYRMTDDSLPENPWYLSEEMLSRFRNFCRIAEENGLRLIVGLLTGWMSGRLFIPPALNDKNIFSDPDALYMQQLFIRGFVSRMKNEKAILAWDLGNECNCMDKAGSRQTAAQWTAAVANAIRAQDTSRPIVSGMHSLTMDGPWTIADQGQWTDILTTHPYPYWIEYADLTPQDTPRTLLHATAQTQIYSDLGGKPCMVEEIGTMGPMICGDEAAAGFLRVNLWSAWAHGFPGLLWWCAFDQDQLTRPPYDWNMVERELGMLHRHGEPKAFANEFKNFETALTDMNLNLSPAQKDGVCILSWRQDQVGVGYMTYVLAKQAGLTLSFVSCDMPLPDSPLYLLPSASGNVMSKRAYMALKQRVREGAALYISLNDGVLTEFEELTGFRVIRSCRREEQGCAGELAYHRRYIYEMEERGGETLLRDEGGNVLLGRHTYGKGTVWLVNAPLEACMLTENENPGAVDVYRKLADNTKPMMINNPNVGVTLHPEADGYIAVLINYSGAEQATGLQVKGNMEVIYGDPETLLPFEAAVVRI